MGAAALRSRREEDQEIDVDDAANPSGDPGPSLEQSTKLVSHGSDHLQMIPSKIRRTDRNQVSSNPSRQVSSGSGNHRAAAATRALCAVGQDKDTHRSRCEKATHPPVRQPVERMRVMAAHWHESRGPQAGQGWPTSVRSGFPSYMRRRRAGSWPRSAGSMGLVGPDQCVSDVGGSKDGGV